MEEIRARLSEIEDQRHPSYVKYPLADILIIVMCAVLCGLDTLGDLVIYAKNKKEFLTKELGIGEIPTKATFARVLSTVNGKEIGDAILNILRMRFGVSGEVIAVDGKSICSTAKPGNPHSALQILSAHNAVIFYGTSTQIEHLQGQWMYLYFPVASKDWELPQWRRKPPDCLSFVRNMYQTKLAQHLSSGFWHCTTARRGGRTESAAAVRKAGFDIVEVSAWIEARYTRPY